VIGDLHVHTNRSDGSYTPREAVLLAKERGLDYIGIVDHDTTEGLEEAIELGLRIGVAVVRGIEISAYDFKRGRKAHLLGYNYAPEASHIKAVCDPMLAARDRRPREQVAAMAAAGYPISIAEVEAVAANAATLGGAATLYKQHAMAVLVRKGAADGIYGAEYRRLFGPGGICRGDIRYADAFDAVLAIHADGGVAVLAHPVAQAQDAEWYLGANVGQAKAKKDEAGAAALLAEVAGLKETLQKDEAEQRELEERLKKALAASIGRSPDEIVVGNGSGETILAAVSVFAGGGTLVLAPPTFSLYGQIGAIASARSGPRRSSSHESQQQPTLGHHQGAAGSMGGHEDSLEGCQEPGIRAPVHGRTPDQCGPDSCSDGTTGQTPNQDQDGL